VREDASRRFRLRPRSWRLASTSRPSHRTTATCLISWAAQLASTSLRADHQDSNRRPLGCDPGALTPKSGSFAGLSWLVMQVAGPEFVRKLRHSARVLAREARSAWQNRREAMRFARARLLARRAPRSGASRALTPPERTRGNEKAADSNRETTIFSRATAFLESRRKPCISQLLSIVPEAIRSPQIPAIWSRFGRWKPARLPIGACSAVAPGRCRSGRPVRPDCRRRQLEEHPCVSRRRPRVTARPLAYILRQPRPPQAQRGASGSTTR
jgi:hypothetical protein